MSEKLTDAELAELAELARLEAAATPGPWVVKERSAIGDVVVCMAWHAPTANWGWWDIDSTVLTPNDGALIAAARNALPRLLAELAALRAESERQLAAERERRETAERLLAKAVEIIIWMSAASDFDEGGKAHIGWEKYRRELDPIFAALAAQPAEGGAK